MALVASGYVDWIFGLAAVGLTLGLVFWNWTKMRTRVHGDFTMPLHEAGRVVDEMRQSQTPLKIPDGSGAQSVRNLVRRINDSLSTAMENSQLSQAKLMSVEAAFDRIYSVLRTLEEGVVVVGSRGEVVLANPAARELMHTERPVEGQPLAELLRGDLQSELSDALHCVLELGLQRQTRNSIHDHGRVFDLQVVPIEAVQSTTSFGTLVVFADVTERHEVARLKDEFLSSVSHELRTPLTNILAYTEILTQMTQQDPESAEFLDIIQTESKRLHRLVDSVLEYTNLESGKTVWQMEQVELGELVRSCAGSFDACAAERSIVIETTVYDDRILIEADQQRLNQAVANVVDNAVKFSDDGGTVKIDVERIEDDRVEIRVHDGGRGVEESDREVIFERLKQIGDTLVDKPAGTGMGLSICVSILEHLGGSIRCVESDLGGACFVIELPAIQAVVEA